MGNDRQELCPHLIPFRQQLIRRLQVLFGAPDRIVIPTLFGDIFVGVDEHDVAVLFSKNRRRATSPKNSPVFFPVLGLEDTMARLDALDAP